MAVKNLNPRILIESINISTSPVNSFVNGKIMIQAWAKTIKDSDRINCARALTYQTVKSYWSAIYKEKNFSLPDLDASIDIPELDNIFIGLGNALGIAASKLSLIQAAYQIGNIYTSV